MLVSPAHHIRRPAGTIIAATGLISRRSPTRQIVSSRHWFDLHWFVRDMPKNNELHYQPRNECRF